MSFYTAGIRTHYIDPINHIGNVRSEFRLDKDRVYLTNFRLSNLGTIVSANNAPPNPLTGLPAMIKNIRLMDGATVLSQFRDYNDYVAWLNLQHQNSSNSSLYHNLNKTNIGRSLKFTSNGELYERANSLPNIGGLGAWWSCREALPLLGAVSYLPTTLFQDLKLVIEWNNRFLDYCNAENTAVNNQNKRPILIVDEVVNETTKQQMISGFNSVAWNEIEKDIMNINGVGGFGTNTGAVVDAVQKVEKRINGYNNKRVGKILFKNRSVDAGDLNGVDTVAGGSVGSKSQLNQKINIRVNGVPMFPFDGVDNDGFRLALTNDMFGAYSMYPSGNIMALGAGGLIVNEAGSDGRIDYFGVDLGGQEVRDLNITYERLNHEDSNSRYSEGMEIQLFGEVAKSLSVMGNNYVVSYA